MAEFGENLKRVREKKGITQQTLADSLYVTRQAVSRWEGGSRYPDIMTAKKMAQFLEVSLDVGLVIYFLVGIVNVVSGMAMDIPIEILRDMILIDTFSLIGNTLVLTLLGFMAHVLHKKRKLVAR